MKRRTVVLNRQVCLECVTLLVFREKITHEYFLHKEPQITTCVPHPLLTRLSCFSVSSAETSAFHSRFPSRVGFGSVFALALALPISSPILFPVSDRASSALWPSRHQAPPSATLGQSSHLSPKGWLCSGCSCEGEEKPLITSHPAVPLQR